MRSVMLFFKAMFFLVITGLPAVSKRLSKMKDVLQVSIVEDSQPTPVGAQLHSIHLKSQFEMCLNARSGKLRRGDLIQIHSCSGAPNEQFEMWDDYTIRVKSKPEMCLNAQSGNLKQGDLIQLHHCSAAANEQFEMFDDYTIRAVKSNTPLCLSAGAGDLNQRDVIQLSPCSALSPNQQFVVPAQGPMDEEDEERQLSQALELSKRQEEDRRRREKQEEELLELAVGESKTMYDQKAAADKAAVEKAAAEKAVAQKAAAEKAAVEKAAAEKAAAEKALAEKVAAVREALELSQRQEEERRRIEREEEELLELAIGESKRMYDQKAAADKAAVEKAAAEKAAAQKAAAEKAAAEKAAAEKALAEKVAAETAAAHKAAAETAAADKAAAAKAAADTAAAEKAAAEKALALAQKEREVKLVLVMKPKESPPAAEQPQEEAASPSGNSIYTIAAQATQATTAATSHSAGVSEETRAKIIGRVRDRIKGGDWQQFSTGDESPPAAEQSQEEKSVAQTALTPAEVAEARWAASSPAIETAGEPEQSEESPAGSAEDKTQSFARLSTAPGFSVCAMALVAIAAAPEIAGAK